MRKPIAVIVALLLTAVLFRLPTPTHADWSAPERVESTTLNTTVTLNPVADAFVNAQYPTTNYGSALQLRIDGSPVVKSYLRFNITGVSGTVTKATLLIYANSSLSTDYKVYAVSNNTWGESTVSYSNAPVMGSLLGSSGLVTAGTWKSVDVTSYVTGNGTKSFGILDPSTTALSLASRESTNKPQLIVSSTGTTPTSTTTSAPTVMASNTPTVVFLPTVGRTPTQSPSPNPPTPTRAPTTAPTPSGTGKVYYVATTGNDTTGNGSTTSPWRTIAKGVSVLNAGDTLYLKGGTYLQSSSLHISRSGTATARITISTAPGEPSLAVISGDTNGNGVADRSDTPATDTSSSTGWELIDITGANVTLQNLEVAYSGKFCVSTRGTGDRIVNSKIHDCWSAGIWAWAPSNVIEGNTVWRAADSNYCGGASGSRECNGNWEGAIAWGDTSPPGNKSPNTIVRRNTVFNNSGEGLLCMQTDYATIEDNVVYDNWAMNIDLDQCSYTTVQRNFAYFSNDTRWWRGGTYPDYNISLSNEGNDGYSVVQHDVKVLNNVVASSGPNIGYWSDPVVNGAALVNYLIANNTVIGTGSSAPLYISAPNSGGAHSNTRIVNNIFVKSSGNMATVPTTTGLTFDHNLWSLTPPTSVRGTGDIVANPLLADPNHTRLPGQVSSAWYAPTASSPAIDRGVSIAGVLDDFLKVIRPRGLAFDIGAFEY